MDRKRGAVSAFAQKTAPRPSASRPDFIEAFCDFTENISSPPLFRKWAAIAAIAGALERKVWVRTLGSNLYPNVYIILVGPPGVGKTEVTWRVRDLWKGMEDHFVASTSVTKASLIDELAAANRRWITHSPENPVEHFNSLLLCINELGVLIPAYENEFMNVLTDLWDCKDYSERRRTAKIEHEIKKTQLNLLAACTPAYLMQTLPEGAWDQGLMSRTMLVFTAERQLRSLFADVTVDTDEEDRLRDQIEQIGNIYGELKFTEGAAKLIDTFHLTGGEPKPEHPKLISYTIRRTVHLLKLSIISSMARSDELLITEDDFHRALGWMLEIEGLMPDIFKAMAQGGTGKVMEEAWYYIFTIYSKEQKPVMLHRLIQFLQERVPVHNVQNTIDLMERGKMIEKRLVANGVAYVPLGKRA
jgi:hypothetical protein